MLLNSGFKFLTRNTIQLKKMLQAGGTLRTLSTTKSFSSNNKTDKDLVLLEDIKDKGVITLNRPKALNAINLPMICTIFEALKKWESCKSLVIIKGAGGKSFCAGGDVVSITREGPTENSKNFFRVEYGNNALIGYYQIPYIALTDGITMGGGVGLSVHAKYNVATERTLFAMPETAIGLFADVGGSYFLPRLQGKLGLYLALTGFRLKGEDVVKAGIATHYCNSSELPKLEKELLECGNKDNVPQLLEKYSNLSSKKFILEDHMEKINKYFGACSVEEIFSNLECDKSEWSQNTLKTLKKMSPTSLKVVFRQLQLGSTLSLMECLKMEYRMVVHFMEDSDFKEGVRALLIDKDQKPKWKAALEEVTEDRVDSFFSELSNGEELPLDHLECSKSKL